MSVTAPSFTLIALCALCSHQLLRSLIPLLRCGLLDHPNSRSSHRVPTPSGGGLAFVIVAIAACGLFLLDSAPPVLLVLLLAAFPLALVGFLDDLRDLPVSLRYSAQLITAAFMLLLSPLAQALFTSQHATLPLGWLLIPTVILLLVAITAVINFANFMDGLDGLVGGCMVVALSASAVQLEAPLPLLALVGSLLGFLPWNWSPAKVFMGDVGSTFLGAVFAGLVLQSSSWSEALGLLLVATPLLADSCLCVLRRMLAGQRFFQPHRQHLFQRLHQAGWSHPQVSKLYIIATAVLAVTLLWGGWRQVVTFAAIELLVGIWLDQRVAVPFAASLTGT
jgi:Fuc2NAc and GlcNAc transferase